MKKELDFFRVGRAYGGNQDWFADPMMRLGGCAAVTACDSSIYFDRYRGTRLYPFHQDRISKKEYTRFGMRMKPYLKPRWSGIDSLDIYIDGYGAFLEDAGCDSIGMKPFSGEESAELAGKEVVKQIDRGFPVPCLTLNHTNPSFKFYEWHWFLLTGYETAEKDCKVKAVTYGSWNWISLNGLWDIGYSRRGGLILYGEK